MQQSGGDRIDFGDVQSRLSREGTQQSTIKQNLNQIKETEVRLGDMISRHIKKQGIKSFNRSSFVVTQRSNFK